MMKTQATATANSALQIREAISFEIPAHFRSLGFKTLVMTIMVAVVLAIAYFGFAINLGTRVATTAEHVINTAQHSLAANFDAPYINHYGFKALFPAQQRVYADIYRAAYLTRDMVTVNDMTESEIANLVQVVCNDSPELFYLSPEVVVETKTISTAAQHSTSKVYLAYSLDKQEIPQARETFKSALADTAANAAACQSDVNKVTLIQDWMQENAQSQATGQTTEQASAPEKEGAQPRETAEPKVSSGNAYDVLVNGQASEDGNVQLFCALCAEVGIDCYAVAADDEAAGAENATNAVMLNGGWHYVDIASDSSEVLA